MSQALGFMWREYINLYATRCSRQNNKKYEIVNSKVLDDEGAKLLSFG